MRLELKKVNIFKSILNVENIFKQYKTHWFGISPITGMHVSFRVRQLSKHNTTNTSVDTKETSEQETKYTHSY